MAYLELILVDEILITLATSEEQHGSTNLLALGGQSSTFLDETAERSNTSTGTNHDDGLGGVGGELEVRVADVDGHVDAVVLVAGTSDRISQTMRIGRRITILLLLESQEVVGGDTLDHVRGTRQTNGLDNSSNADLVLLNRRRGRDGVVPGLELVETFDEQGERNGVERLAGDALQRLGDVEALIGDLLVEIVLVITQANKGAV